jgi:hypothetical protein
LAGEISLKLTKKPQISRMRYALYGGYMRTIKNQLRVGNYNLIKLKSNNYEIRLVQPVWDVIEKNTVKKV